MSITGDWRMFLRHYPAVRRFHHPAVGRVKAPCTRINPGEATRPTEQFEDCRRKQEIKDQPARGPKFEMK